MTKMDDFKEGNSAALNFCDSFEVGSLATINFCFDNTNLTEFTIDRESS